VRKYLVSVCREILTDYPVDGLHLDYIRFPNEESPRGSDYPRDQRTLALYRKATGNRPDEDKASWINWRTAQVTQLVKDIRSMQKRVRPKAKLTAACAPDPAEARKYRFQDGPAWVRARYIDLAFVMNYSRTTQTFRARQEAWRRAAPGKPVAVGIGIYMHGSDAVTLEQMRLAQRWGDGFGLFSSESLFDGSSRSEQRLDAITPTLLSMQTDAQRAAKRKADEASAVKVNVGATGYIGGATGGGSSRNSKSRRGMVP
jgi:uncharacterized lipoprotein YddW (UPF0748 family)